MKILNKKIAAKKSSAAWIQRQAADPYVARAHKEGYRARAAYKLIEMNERFKFLKNGQVVVDLGAAPGSWTQYVMREFPKSKVFAMDLLEIKPIPGVEFYQGDFTTDAALQWLEEKLNLPAESDVHGNVDVVLSDMAPNTVGHKKTDHLRQMVLLEYAFDFALRALKPGGTFVAKSFTGGTTGELLKQIKEKFESVHHIKPPASRKDSVEMFIVAMGFKG
ncbi:MAG TPA: RlmE family RNA methyltransferase [Candidatus Enterousia avicola]|uniref:Ribosomal RNA large subunit methyltransferase E n=1 Tax=Candidatus Enterousia avicola TaxID=2840787 RepID=A0A9D1MSC3_9PROT|nr:RlmE family RNA methyltransferase [Candidatus Enterousia avicola]